MRPAYAPTDCLDPRNRPADGSFQRPARMPPYYFFKRVLDDDAPNDPHRQASLHCPQSKVVPEVPPESTFRPRGGVYLERCEE